MSDWVIENPYQSFIHKSRYARWLDKKNRRESWQETVDRYINFMIDELGDKYDSLDIFEEVRQAILNLEVLPSMRALMTAGPALKRDNLVAYNCSYVAIDHPRAFDEAMYILMGGVGLGFSVERKYIDKLPEVAEDFYLTDTTIIVHDSRIGWAKAFKELIGLLYTGQIPSYDTSGLRPAGERLKVMGGRSSGPEPLEELFNFSIELFINARGRRLNSIECHDLMCKIAEIVIVGGVRRSAMISFSDLGDFDLAKAKSGRWWDENPQRALANNTAIYNGRPNNAQFLREWRNLYESKSGERGIKNIDADRRHTEKFGRREYSEHTRGNPCVDGSTLIMTSEGLKRISEIDKDFYAVVNGKTYPAKKPFITGFKTLYKMTTEEGFELNLTRDHKVMTKAGWKKAIDLTPGDKIIVNDHNEIDWGRTDNFGDGYVLGHFVGDGNFSKYRDGKHSAFCKVWDIDGEDRDIADFIYKIVENKPHRSDWKGWGSQNGRPFSQINITSLVNEYNLKPDNKHDVSIFETESSEFLKGFLRGIFDADGHVEGFSNDKGLSIRICQSDYKLLQCLQRMLLSLGIYSKIRDLRPEGTSLLPDGKGGMKNFNVKRSYRLIISSRHAKSFINQIGSFHISKKDKMDKGLERLSKGFYFKENIATFKELFFEKVEDVWDTTVETVHAFDANGLYVHNCNEIKLLPNQLCNLSEIVVSEKDTKESLRRKARIATIIGTWQSTLTDFKYVRSIWKKTTEKERLLGVSMTGIFGNPLVYSVSDETKGFLSELRDLTVEINKEHSEILGIPQSVAITTVKPAGTTSQLTMTSSGIHPWHSQYYIRRVRGDNKDPLTIMLKEIGVVVEPDVMNPQHTSVFSFPIKAPDQAVFQKDISAIEHLEIWKMFRENWTEHNPSITVSVKEDEWIDVAAWVYKNFDYLSGVSFLPAADHTYQQAPYEEITKEQYDDLVEKSPKEIDWNWLSYYETEDGTTGTQELACSSGDCEIVDIK